MERVKVQFAWVDPEQTRGRQLPAYESKLAAGMDIPAAIAATLCIQPGEITLVGSGFAVAIPDGYELQIRPRSGLAVKYGVTVVNSPGTIDADYRGEIKVGLINLGQEPFYIKPGDRIAQMILAPVCQAALELVEKLDVTDRGAGGFGHTGV